MLLHSYSLIQTTRINFSLILSFFLPSPFFPHFQFISYAFSGEIVNSLDMPTRHTRIRIRLPTSLFSAICRNRGNPTRSNIISWTNLLSSLIWYTKHSQLWVTLTSSLWIKFNSTRWTSFTGIPESLAICIGLVTTYRGVFLWTILIISWRLGTFHWCACLGAHKEKRE